MSRIGAIRSFCIQFRPTGSSAHNGARLGNVRPLKGLGCVPQMEPTMISLKSFEYRRRDGAGFADGGADRKLCRSRVPRMAAGRSSGPAAVHAVAAVACDPGGGGMRAGGGTSGGYARRLSSAVAAAAFHPRRGRRRRDRRRASHRKLYAARLLWRRAIMTPATTMTALRPRPPAGRR